MPDPSSPLDRIETGIPGLDAVLDGGLVVGAVCLVVGPPGTGKTTLGSQVAFHHARAGRSTVFATVLGESHERMIGRLDTFRFFDEELVGTHVHYVSLLDALDDDGIDGLLTLVRREVRARDAMLLVIDGMPIIEELAASPAEFRRFVNRLQAAMTLVGCTTLLLGGTSVTDLLTAATQADGILAFALDPVGVRDHRTVRAVKFRGTEHLLGRHDIVLSGAGLEVFPRLEAMVGGERPAWHPTDRLSTGITGLDLMLGGGLIRGTSTLLVGTPGSGKTITGVHLIAAGVAAGERGLIATFHENAEGLTGTTAMGGVVARGIDEGLVEVMWRSALECSPDAWAWELLDRVDRHQPDRLLIDGISDIGRLHLFPERMASYLAALTNELRQRRVTIAATVEIESYVGPMTVAPIPAISAIVDNTIMLRHVEIQSRLRRLVSVPKARRSAIDPKIREFVISQGGIVIGEPFRGVEQLLTGSGRAEPRLESGSLPVQEPS